MPYREAAIIVLLASTLIGGKPPPPPSTTTPQIAYVNISGGARRHYQLRLANEDGTQAATIYSSKEVGQMVPHMGPAADKTIVLVQGGRVSLVRYKIGSTGTAFDGIEPLFTINSASGAQNVDFSPNGQDIVWWDRPNNKLMIFNLTSRASTVLLQLASEPNHFAFNRDGTSVLFLDHVSDTQAVLKRVALADRAVTTLGVEGDFWGVEAAHGSNALILTRGLGRTSRIEYHPMNGSGTTDLANGYVPSFRCDDAVVIYQQINPDSSVSLLRVEPLSGSDYTTSTSGNYWPDYVGC